MLYTLLEMNRVAMAPLRIAAKASRAALRSPFNPWAHTSIGRSMAAAADVFESATRYYGKPDWQIESTQINGIDVPIRIQQVWSDTWCKLTQFKRDESAIAEALPKADRVQDKLLIVAPLSGHYATLLRGTVEAFLPHYDVYITDGRMRGWFH